MRVYEKINRVERMYLKLQNENRDNECYMDDLLDCFIQCWSIKEWIINDDEVKSKHSDIKNMVTDYIKNDQYIQLCIDIANRDKHLELKQKWVDGDISNSKIGVHYGEHITASIASITIEFKHVNDLVNNESEEKDRIITEVKTHVPIEDKTFITQEYEVTDNLGNTYNALTVLSKAISSWKSFVQKELYN